MIKQIIHKGFSVILSLLVLFSTVSFTVEKHFCGDNLVDIALFTNAKTCGMETETNSSETCLKKKSCCKDEVDVHQGQDELTVNGFDELNWDQQLFLTSFAYSYINLFEILKKEIVPHKNYSPPNLVADIQLLNDTFLI